MIYLGLLIYIILCVYYIDIKKIIRYRKVLYWLLCLFFILLSGLRYKIGGDSLSYMDSWELYPTLWDGSFSKIIKNFKNLNPEFERYQPGWIIYSILIKTLSTNFNSILFTTAIIFNITIFYTIQKYSKYTFTTILIFYFNFKFLEFEFEIIREVIAISIFLICAYPNYIKKSWFGYYFGCFLGLMFHYSILVMLLLPIVRNLNYSLLKYSIIFFFSSLILGIFGHAYIGKIIGLALGGSGFIGDYIANAFGVNYNMNYIIMYAFQPVCLYIFICLNWNSLKNSPYAPILFFSIVFMNLSLIYFTAIRLISYLIIIDIIALTPIFINKIHKYKTILIAIYILSIYNIPTFYSFMTDPLLLARYYPYHSILNPYQTKEQKYMEYESFINRYSL